MSTHTISNEEEITSHKKQTFFEISLAEWSLHNSIFSNRMTNLDFPEIARRKFEVGIVEYVNQFFMDKANDKNYLNDLLKRCQDNGIKNHLIMCDNEGPLADPDKKKRTQAIENHYKWVDAARHLGCQSIRVNTFGEGSEDEVLKAAADGLEKLSDYASQAGINIIVENHGGFTSNGTWIARLMRTVNKKNVGTLPDFGNFCTKRDGNSIWDGKCVEQYDRYKGVEEMMPYAMGVSAKTMGFDNDGECTETDYFKMIRIVRDSGFHGYIGIEFSSESADNEEEGIRKTRELLERVAAEM